MSEKSEQLTLFPPTSFAGATRARTSRAQEKARDLVASARVSGLSLPGSSVSSGQRGLSLKMWPAVRSDGSTRYVLTWAGEVMQSFRSRCRRLMSAHRTEESGFSLLPTPSATSYGSSNNGNPGDGRGEYATKGKPSLWTMAAQGLLPTPTETANHLSPDSMKWPANRRLAALATAMLPTPAARSWKDNGSPAEHGRSSSIPAELGLKGRLNPRFVGWMMGFPRGWLD